MELACRSSSPRWRRGCGAARVGAYGVKVPVRLGTWPPVLGVPSSLDLHSVGSLADLGASPGW